jgi:mRNA-degrading endonuclease RelE of RelBE toxin-antitoxin system
MQHHLETENLASRFRRLQSHGNRADPVPPPIRVKAAGEFIALHLPDAVKARAGSRSEGESSSLWLWPWIHPPWQLRRVPQNARSRLQKRQRIDAKLTIYATKGSGDVKRLKGADGCRLRIGDWRVILIEDARSITVIAVETAKRFTAERKTS